MKKSFLFTIAAIVCIIAFQAFTIADDPEWENLHILPKDISEDGLDSVMHHFTRSLGVKCSYCHVYNKEADKMEFASDAKPEKLIARKMMLMTIDINKNHFVEIEKMMDSTTMAPTDTLNVKYMLSAVTCYTCHHGEPHAELKPPPKKEDHHLKPPPEKKEQQ